MKYIFFVFLAIIIYRLLHFLTTPILKKLGIYKYYTPLFLIVPYMPRRYEIHLGTSWDFFQLPQISPKIYIDYLTQGLLELIEDIENCKIQPDVMFKGCTYYLKIQTMERFGFHSRKLKPYEFLIFLLSYIEVIILHSISNKKITIISFKNLIISTITAQELQQKKNEILKLVPDHKNGTKDYIMQF